MLLVETLKRKKKKERKKGFSATIYNSALQFPASDTVSEYGH